MSYSGRTRGLSKVRETAFGVTPASPVMREVRALKDYEFNAAPGVLESAAQYQDRMTRKTRNGNKKGEFSIPFELSYGDFDDFFEEILGGTWTPIATVTANITVAAAGKTFTRAAGSFLDDGFAVGQEIVTSGFAQAGNNGTFIISAVTELVITCDSATGLADENGTDDTVTTTADKLLIGNISRSSTYEDRNPDANLYEQYNGGVLNGFDVDVSPEKIVTGSFKGILRDCRLAAVVNRAISVAAGAKTFTCPSGGFLKKGSAFAIGDNIITSGFTNAGNNGTFVISAVTDTVITCSTATGLATEAAGAGKYIVLGSLGEPIPAGTDEPYDSYTGDLSDGQDIQAEATGIKISYDNGMKANYTILNPAADTASSIKPDSDIKITGDFSIFFEDQAFKQRFLAGEESSIAFTLGTGLPGGRSMRFIMRAVQYTGNKRSKDSTIIETASYKANKHAATGTAIEIQRIP